MNDILKPCPFCGSGKIDPEGWATLPEYAKTPDERHGPACDDCGATAPSIEVWNTRNSPITTLYLERSEVRAILIRQSDDNLNVTELVLHDVDALPSFSASDIMALTPPERQK